MNDVFKHNNCSTFANRIIKNYKNKRTIFQSSFVRRSEWFFLSKEVRRNFTGVVLHK